MKEITKEEFEAFAELEFPGKARRYKDNFCFIQAGTYFGELLHYEFINHKVHLHIEVDDYKVIRDYLSNNVSTYLLRSNYWNRKDCQWTLQDQIIQNAEDVKDAFRKIRQLIEPHIIRLEQRIKYFHINHQEELSEKIMNKYDELINLYQDTCERIKNEKQSLPYHINIVDELHINENAHSRILLKLLQYMSSKGEYEIYESLIEYICQKSKNSSFDEIKGKIKKPHFTQEEQRIDLWVRDDNYAVIFENKACYACDQPEQLSNYIKKTQNSGSGYKKNDIYIVYLSPNGEEPEEQSWGEYKDDFSKRYMNLSYKNDIIPWLKNCVQPNIRQKDIYLQTAIAQYIDHLEGVFYLRPFQKQLNMNLNEYFFNRFDFKEMESDYPEQAKYLQQQLDDLQAVLNKMSEYQTTIREQIFSQWREKTKKLFPDLKPCEMADQSFSDVSIEIEQGKPFIVSIAEDSKLYCQVEFDRNIPNEQRLIKGSAIEELRDILPLSNDHCIWQYFPRHNYSDVYSLFCDVVNRLIKIKQTRTTSTIRDNDSEQA